MGSEEESASGLRQYDESSERRTSAKSDGGSVIPTRTSKTHWWEMLRPSRIGGTENHPISALELTQNNRSGGGGGGGWCGAVTGRVLPGLGFGLVCQRCFNLYYDDVIGMTHARQPLHSIMQRASESEREDADGVASSPSRGGGQWEERSTTTPPQRVSTSRVTSNMHPIPYVDGAVDERHCNPHVLVLVFRVVVVRHLPMQLEPFRKR